MTALISWHSPFSESDVLINLSSGVVTTNDVQKDLMRAQVVGEETLEKFMTERLRGDIAGFYDPIPQLKLRTFSSMLKDASMNIDKGKLVLKANSKLFSRMLIIAQTRSLDLHEVLKYELGPLPWSLSTVHGCFMKTDKSKLLHLLEQYSQPVDVVPADAAVIVDGMAML